MDPMLLEIIIRVKDYSISLSLKTSNLVNNLWKIQASLIRLNKAKRGLNNATSYLTLYETLFKYILTCVKSLGSFVSYT